MRGENTNESAIRVTAFRARCLALIDEVAQGKTGRVLLMKHKRPVAAIVSMEHEPAELWGATRGTVKAAPRTGQTEGTGEVWKSRHLTPGAACAHRYPRCDPADER
jgi:antitoxin (DNA-binding transcriptional repressor) of toxin-antitoxin stability system